MFRNDHRLALRLDKPQMLPQFANRCHIEVGGRFVKQIDLRVHGIDGSKGDFLLLSAGEGKDIAAQQVFDTECPGRFRHTPFHPILRHSLVFHAERDLAVGIHIEKLCPGVLKHAADLFGDAIHGKVGEAFAVKQYLAAQFTREELRNQPIDQPGQRGFPATTPSAQQDALPIGYRQAYVFQPTVRTVRIGKRHILKFDHTPTAFHTISAARKAVKSTIARKSADLI